MRKLVILLSLFCHLSAHAADSNKTVRRLRVEDYPELPAGVAAVLQRRHCTIPQPNKDGPARNVIKGEFFRKGQKGWGVLCSSGASPRSWYSETTTTAVRMRLLSPRIIGSSSTRGRAARCTREKSPRWTKKS